ncbi:MAG: hypothetical protein KDD64_04145 [Bdellovibrionales bacterium]|nr:hypothetical protein [Bdellovibrionales bacterium]
MKRILLSVALSLISLHSAHGAEPDTTCDSYEPQEPVELSCTFFDEVSDCEILGPVRYFIKKKARLVTTTERCSSRTKYSTSGFLKIGRAANHSSNVLVQFPDRTVFLARKLRGRGRYLGRFTITEYGTQEIKVRVDLNRGRAKYSVKSATTFVKARLQFE